MLSAVTFEVADGISKIKDSPQASRYRQLEILVVSSSKDVRVHNDVAVHYMYIILG